PLGRTLVGVDISQGMVIEFNKGVQSHGIPTTQIYAVRADLKDEETELEGAKFDVVVCSLAYHHLEDIATATRLLAFFLKPGGVMLVTDFPTMDVSTTAMPADFAHTIAHKGGIFEAVIKEAYDGVGLVGFAAGGVQEAQTLMHPEEIFLASGVKLLEAV
ncbi:S-adenosyl-L-methionine-dependent methyltransferase, partial [Mycena galericulata]